jgi:hypothetical protein
LAPAHLSRFVKHEPLGLSWQPRGKLAQLGRRLELRNWGQASSPRIRSAARPAIMWVDAFFPGPVMICGITEASVTRKLEMPCTRSSRWTTASLSTPILPVPKCVSKTRRGQSGKFPDLLGARLGPGNEFALAQTVEGMLISKLTRGFDGRRIVIRA